MKDPNDPRPLNRWFVDELVRRLTEEGFSIKPSEDDHSPAFTFDYGSHGRTIFVFDEDSMEAVCGIASALAIYGMAMVLYTPDPRMDCVVRIVKDLVLSLSHLETP